MSDNNIASLIAQANELQQQAASIFARIVELNRETAMENNQVAGGGAAAQDGYGGRLTSVRNTMLRLVPLRNRTETALYHLVEEMYKNVPPVEPHEPDVLDAASDHLNQMRDVIFNMESAGKCLFGDSDFDAMVQSMPAGQPSLDSSGSPTEVEMLRAECSLLRSVIIRMNEVCGTEFTGYAVGIAELARLIGEKNGIAMMIKFNEVVKRLDFGRLQEGTNSVCGDTRYF